MMKFTLLLLAVSATLLASSSAAHKISLPDFFNSTEREISCETEPKYCSGADSRSSVSLGQIWARSNTINVDDQGQFSFQGYMSIMYSARLYTPGWVDDFKEFIEVKLTGTVLLVDGQVDKVVLDQNPDIHPEHDKVQFVHNAALLEFQVQISKNLENHLNRFLHPSS